MGRHEAPEQGAQAPPGKPTVFQRLVRKIPVLRTLLRDGEWKRGDTLTVIGLVLTATLAIWQHLSSGQTAGAPDLVLDKVEVAHSADIDATITEPGDPPSGSNSKIVGSVIDITLRNRGSAPALLIGADLSFQSARQLQNCTGAGPGVATALYDVPVPTDPNVVNHPFKLHRDMRFIVNPNSIDRLQISVGPESYGLADWPWVYQFDLALAQDNGQTLDVGNIALIGITGEDWNKFQGIADQLTAPETIACYTQDAGLLSKALQVSGLHSPELKTLYNEAKADIASASSCQPPGPDGNGCYITNGRYFSDPGNVVACTTTIQVLSNYNCDAAKAVAAAYGHSGLSTVSLTVVSGLLELPMNCSPSGNAEVCRSADNQNLVVGFVP